MSVQVGGAFEPSRSMVTIGFRYGVVLCWMRAQATTNCAKPKKCTLNDRVEPRFALLFCGTGKANGLRALHSGRTLT